MANFYKINRSKLDILMNRDGTPKEANGVLTKIIEKKLPEKVQIPKHLKFISTTHTEELKKFVEKIFKNHPGSTNNFWFPTTRDQTQKLLDHFLKDKLNLFGDYEDSVSKKSNILFHSALSPAINLGLITPIEILEKVKKIEKKIRINSLEGYIRQIIGWREFMRGIYQNYDKRLEDSIFLIIKIE